MLTARVEHASDSETEEEDDDNPFGDDDDFMSSFPEPPKAKVNIRNRIYGPVYADPYPVT